MTLTLHTGLILVALICFLLATFGAEVSPRFSFLAFGLACFAAAELIR